MHSILTKISSGTSTLQHRIIPEMKLPTLPAQGILTRWQAVWTYHAGDRCLRRKRSRVELNYLPVWNNKQYSNVYVSMLSLFMASPLRNVRRRLDVWKRKQTNVQCLSGRHVKMPSAPNNSCLDSSRLLKYDNFPELCSSALFVPRSEQSQLHQDRQCAYSPTLRRVRATSVAVGTKY
jgi:hypothetical protein